MVVERYLKPLDCYCSW